MPRPKNEQSHERVARNAQRVAWAAFAGYIAFNSLSPANQDGVEAVAKAAASAASHTLSGEKTVPANAAETIYACRGYLAIGKIGADSARVIITPSVNKQGNILYSDSENGGTLTPATENLEWYNIQTKQRVANVDTITCAPEQVEGPRTITQDGEKTGTTLTTTTFRGPEHCPPGVTLINSYQQGGIGESAELDPQGAIETGLEFGAEINRYMENCR